MPPRRRPRTQIDSEPCGAPSCNRLVTNHSGGVQCSEWPTWFHIGGGGFSRSVQIPEHWQCPLCTSIGLTQALENLRITTKSPENFNPDNDNQEVPNHDVTNFSKKRTPTLNRVPKGARKSLAELFQKLLTELLRDPTDANKWLHLLTMTKQCLKQPTRGGKKYNLTAHVRKQITDFSSSEDLTRTSENGPSRPARKRESSLNSRVSKKMDAGDVKGALRAVCSDDSIAPDIAETLQQLAEKHPRRTTPLTPRSPISTSSRTVIANVVKTAILSFPAGSAGGPTVMCPQILKDLISPSNGHAGTRLLEKLTEFVNLVLSGNLPPRIRPIFFGANLIALGKKGGGIRRIAVGNTLRRLSAKCAGTIAKSNRCVEYGNVQLGYGTQRGAEAAAHATRLYVRQKHSPDQKLLKIDLKNAFNSISRDALLATVFAKTPLIYNYTEAAYAKPSFLFYRDKIILSEEGAQQGDPEGPPLFFDTINDTIRSFCSKLNLWHLDDGNVARTFKDVRNDYTTLRSTFLAMGLKVNPQKCELVFLGCPSNDQKQSILSKFSEVCPGVQVAELEDLVVLGVPIASKALESTVEEKTQVFQAFPQKLQGIDAHYALFLIKNCLYMLRLLYVLRTSPCFKLCEKLQRLDNYLRASLESICNVSLSKSRDKQVFLPVKLVWISHQLSSLHLLLFWPLRWAVSLFRKT